ncbi:MULTISPECIES: GGDEF domain-containing protein [Rhizobium]|uniref:diguanylate cyclase n=1 Tax=Rhizobium wuzhouense TaxID=1986026 RepID=A0ABX5NVI5_9HYPH|nr:MULTISPECIES: GGDEF domain-containing protein [Rhizobium]PYB73411.1 GGDEF domain-containing protein [Rhizobium wuzhouense]RKE83946.1 diguanylate cyclase (GGDEF)-like protein [Rhizobium sp. AG855]
MDIIRTWLWRQIDLGTFDNQKAILGFALSVSCRAVILASAISLATLPVLYGFGFLTMPIDEAVKITVAFSWLFGGAFSGAFAFVAGLVIRDLTQSRAEFERLSRTDTLSGLANRRAFNDAFARVDGEASLAIIDIDRFKSINDRFGHNAGDLVIQEISAIFRQVFGERHLVARLGGEEFGVILNGSEPAQRLALVERARSLVAGRGFVCDGIELSVTMSAGVAEFLPDRRPEWVYAQADKALYLAKSHGRNRVMHEQALSMAEESAADYAADPAVNFNGVGAKG